ncbi:MAG TPA: AAA family ATPase, partial [Thermoanaerobaculia bacterium]|nr:AAA family ATPase [Thermoanaerobaculia bacterium]
MKQTVVGQDTAIETLLAAYIAGGHTLIEGVPGIAKTLLARVFASSLGLKFSRVQFTPDLMPSDLLGTNVFDEKSGAFRLVRGPIFTEVLMADEINRTPPKTQSALLEAMQENQATIDGVSHSLDPSFFVIATQNPIEFEGT